MQDQDTMHQDELASLFSRNLRLDRPPSNAISYARNAHQAVSSPLSDSQPITYISQHYTHSAHISSKAHPEPSSIRIDNPELEEILLRNSIDPLLLVPAQLKLFKNADDGQRLRLLELWRISPPVHRGQDAEESGETSLQREETLVRLRYGFHQETAGKAPGDQLNEQRMWSETEQMVAYTAVGHGQATLAASQVLDSPPSPEDSSKNAEPYIVSGYEYLSRREYDENVRSLGESKRYNQALDPAYDKSMGEGLWSKPGTQDMENQYGTFAQMRDFGGERLNQRHAFAGMHVVDDEMVM